MGFPNIDKMLQKLFVQKVQEAQADPQTLIDDLFDDLDSAEQAEISQYLLRKEFTKDVRDRGSKVFVTLSFIMTDVPFPQIGITLGQENTDRWIGDAIGESVAVTDTTGKTIAWDVVKGYYAKSSWNVTIAAATKDEVIWLSRLCQHSIMSSMDDLAGAGVAELDVAMADLQLQADQQPMTVFSRQLRITATTENTWKKRIPASYYATGNNTALA
ncbi:hypothetical protein [Oryzomonas rubra]|uniref:Uncharacterized protein n=1 Tax=Oryzomonas rubra TaxID=2509454 RepID=A0A5A9X7Y3_9BACT|nr:hypothetical protein [Oryzomonas rubra]KAA0888763.1 hypothetical protein ET418_15395 [Oryzomonas rubra]